MTLARIVVMSKTFATIVVTIKTLATVVVTSKTLATVVVTSRTLATDVVMNKTLATTVDDIDPSDDWMTSMKWKKEEAQEGSFPPSLTQESYKRNFDEQTSFDSDFEVRFSMEVTD